MLPDWDLNGQCENRGGYFEDSYFRGEEFATNDLINTIKEKNDDLQFLSNLHDSAMQFLEYGLVAFELGYVAYAMYTCPYFVGFVAASKFSIDYNMPYGLEVHILSKLMLNICLMNTQFDFLKNHGLLDIGRIEMLSNISFKPLNVFAIEGSLDLAKNLLSWPSNELSSYRLEDEKESESKQWKYLAASLVKRWFKYEAKNIFEFESFGQAMIGDMAKYKFLTFASVEVNNETFLSDTTINNFIKYEICYIIFPGYQKYYRDSVGMHFCRKVSYSFLSYCDLYLGNPITNQ